MCYNQWMVIRYFSLFFVAFSSSNEPRSRKKQILSIFLCYSSWIFCNKGFHLVFEKNAWTYVETLLMENVGLVR